MKISTTFRNRVKATLPTIRFIFKQKQERRTQNRVQPILLFAENQLILLYLLPQTNNVPLETCANERPFDCWDFLIYEAVHHFATASNS